jgi:hypothetical protein
MFKKIYCRENDLKGNKNLFGFFLSLTRLFLLSLIASPPLKKDVPYPQSPRWGEETSKGKIVINSSFDFCNLDFSFFKKEGYILKILQK